MNDYYMHRAQTVLTRAGAPDADPAPAAAWARQAHPHTGVLVAQSGAVLAEVEHVSAPGRAGAWYVTRVAGIDTGTEQLTGMVADFAQARIFFHTGERTVLLSYSELAQGPGGAR